MERRQTVYALLALWQLPEEPWDHLLPQLEAGLTPLISGAAGVVEGYWTYEPANGKSVALVLLETADHAYDLRNTLERHMESGREPAIELEMLRVQRVMARLETRDGTASAGNHTLIDTT
jgi:hypothetical protein